MTEALVPEPGIGPRREQVDGEPAEGFAETVGALADGAILLPPPFDLPAAAALLRNTDSGDAAEKLFETGRNKTVHYRVNITAFLPDHPELGEREMINTVALGPNSLAAILDHVFDEIQPPN